MDEHAKREVQNLKLRTGQQDRRRRLALLPPTSGGNSELGVLTMVAQRGKGIGLNSAVHGEGAGPEPRSWVRCPVLFPSQRELTQGRPLPSMLIFSDMEWPAWHCPAAHNWRARVPTHIWPYSPVWRQSWVLSRFSINIWSTGLGDRSQLLPSGLVSDPGMNPPTPPRAWEESRDKGQVGGEANRQGPSSGSGGPTARLAP